MRILTFLSVLILIGCGQPIENVNESSRFCENEHYLLCPDSSLIEMNLGLSKDSIFEIIGLEDSINSNCRDFIDFKTSINILEDTIDFLSTVYTGCQGTIYCGIEFDVEILINSRNKILANRSLVQIDSLKKAICSFYKDTNNIIHPTLIIKWDSLTSTQLTRKVIKEIIDGYLAAANIFSIKTNKKLVCNLDKKQLIKLNKDFPFKLEIFYKKSKHPDPPEKMIPLKIIGNAG